MTTTIEKRIEYRGVKGETEFRVLYHVYLFGLIRIYRYWGKWIPLVKYKPPITFNKIIPY